ncbi:uncharacterized protein METZ01_LOCUS172339, partial [marine metagenome]
VLVTIGSEIVVIRRFCWRRQIVGRRSGDGLEDLWAESVVP